MNYDRYEARKSASAFYDGGWRAADKEELRQQVDHVRDCPVSDEELDYIVCCMADLEADRRCLE